MLIAFHADALDKLARTPDESALGVAQRVSLALRSYLELIIDYALLYWLLPASMWRRPLPSSPSEMLWFSASTITTSGGGGFTLAHWLPQLLSVLEVFGGVILLVVCFTIYAGRATGEAADPPAG